MKDVYDHISARTIHFRALVHLQQLNSSGSEKGIIVPPLVERLGEYAPNKLDLDNLVTYPPKLRPVPVKPLFFDLAWNYIDYPDQNRVQSGTAAVAAETPAKEEQKPVKKGWFGFGRG